MGEAHRELQDMPIIHDMKKRPIHVLSGGRKEKFHISKSEDGVLSGKIK